MTLDQKNQIWMAVGTWVSSIGTIAAVITALYLAARVEKLRLRVRVGLMQVVIGDGTPFQEHLGIDVTNVGERPVTINTIGWAVGLPLILPPSCPGCQRTSLDNNDVEKPLISVYIICLWIYLDVAGSGFGSANGDRTRTLSLERAAC